MRNGKQLQAFIDKVTKEANEAAQSVFDKYQEELNRRIYAQLKDGDWLVVGNGTAFIKDKNGEYVHADNSLVHSICSLQYRNENLTASFSTNDMKK